MNEQPSPPCFLCGPPLGGRVEWHHRLPRRRAGRETVPVHPIGHRASHRALDNQALARDYASVAALRADPEVARFLDRVASKNPDFHIPTRRG